MYQVTVDYAKANLEELCDRTETQWSSDRS